MLTTDQSRDYDRFKKLQTFFNLKQNVYAAFQPFADEVNLFNENFAALEELAPDKNVTSTGITATKRELKQKIAAALALVCRKTRAYAIRYNNADLAAQTNTRDDLIFKMRDADLFGYAKTIQGVVQPLLGDTNFIAYGITQEQLDSIVTDAQNFNSMINAADVVASGSTVANTAINGAIDILHTNIQQFDLLIDEFAENNPDFVEGYHINSALNNTGVRHSGIEGKVHTQTGAALSGAIIQLQGTTKKAVTDLNGVYRVERAMPDDYLVVCTVEGYEPKTVMHHISRGKIDELNFVL